MSNRSFILLSISLVFLIKIVQNQTNFPGPTDLVAPMFCSHYQGCHTNGCPSGYECRYHSSYPCKPTRCWGNYPYCRCSRECRKVKCVKKLIWASDIRIGTSP